MSSIKINRFGSSKQVFYDMILTYVELKHHDDLQLREFGIISVEELISRAKEQLDILTKSILESTKPRYLNLVRALKQVSTKES